MKVLFSLALFLYSSLIFSMDQRSTTTKQDSALHHVVQEGASEYIIPLLKSGADVNSIISQATPLTIAIREENVKVVELLLTKGTTYQAPVDQVSHRRPAWVTKEPDLNPLLQALQLTNQEAAVKIIRLLLQYHIVLLNKPFMDGRTPLTTALEYQKIDLIRVLLEHGADITTLSFNQSITEPLTTNTGTILVLLLQYGASVSKSSNEQEGIISYPAATAAVRDPLEQAALFGNNDKVKLLLKNNNKFSPDTLNQALSYAAGQCHKTIVEQLLIAGAQPTDVLPIITSILLQPRNSTQLAAYKEIQELLKSFLSSIMPITNYELLPPPSPTRLSSKPRKKKRSTLLRLLSGPND